MKGYILKNCPNCGGSGRVHTKKKGRFYIECDGDCWTATHVHSSMEDAINEWNSLEPTKHEEKEE